MNIFKNKNILVTGGTGMIGIYLIEKLIKYNPKKILSVSLDSSSEMHKDVEFKSIDLRNFQNFEFLFIFFHFNSNEFISK